MRRACSVITLLLAAATNLVAQEYTVHAVDDATGKSLSGMQITLRYSCGSTIPFHCKWITRKTGKDGLAHFPEAGSLRDIDDIYSLQTAYTAVSDLQPKTFPSMDIMRFRRRSFGEMIQWVIAGLSPPKRNEAMLRRASLRLDTIN